MEKEKKDQKLQSYIQNIDQQNSDAVSNFLDEQFRVVVPNFNNSDSAMVLTREQYLNMIKKKKIGGAQRSIEIRFIEHERNMAVAALITKNANMTMRTYLNLLKKNNNWLVVNDMPEISNN